MEPNSLSQAAWNVGLGIALSCALFGAFVYFLRRMVASNERTLRLLDSQLEAKDKIIGNHLDHVQVEREQVKSSIATQERTIDAVGDRVCEAIRAQTELMRELLRYK
jgi:hypothetical protein